VLIGPPWASGSRRRHTSWAAAGNDVGIELEALGLVGERAEAFMMGRAAGTRAARRHGPVPQAVVDAMALMIAGDPAVRVAG